MDEATNNNAGVCNLEATQQRLVQRPGCLGGLRARRLSRGGQSGGSLLGRVGPACAGLSRSWRPCWAGEMTRVADTDLVEQAR